MNSPLLWFIFWIAVTASYRFWRRHAQCKVLGRVARGLELYDGTSIFGHPGRVWGEVEYQQVSISPYGDRKKRYSYLIRIEPSRIFPFDIQMRNRDLLGQIGEAVGINHLVKTGAEEFDRLMAVTGSNEGGIAGLLDGRSRQHALEIRRICRTWRVAPTQIEIEVSAGRFAGFWPDSSRSDDLLKVIDEAIGLCLRLIRLGDTQNLLADSVLADTDPDVRLHCLLLLARDHMGEARTASVLEQAMTDKDWAVRLGAADALGKDGVTFICNLLSETQRPWPEPAIRFLATRDEPACVPFLKQALEDRRNVAEAARALGRTGAAEALDILLRTLRRPALSKVDRLAILEVLQALGDERAQELLLELVRQESLDTTIKVATLKALGTCGRVNAVEFLLPLAEASGVSTVKSAAQETINRIQAALGPVESGWLSLSNQTKREGALSLTLETGTGALSLTDAVGQGEDGSVKCDL